MKNTNYQTIIPTRIIEGMNINYLGKIEQINIPISTYETPLFASINRGIKVSKNSPINVSVLSNCMTRSIILQCKNIFEIEKLLKILQKEENNNFVNFQNVVNITSSHCKILKINKQIVGNLVYLRFSFDTKEASGHNMTTIATNEIAKYIIKETKKINIIIKYLSNSGNICCDKKVSAINSIQERGKKVIAEIIINKKICEEILHTTPKKIVDLNIKKNLIGSTIAGSICSSNAHYANMLASIYLPLGQDIANIIEGSQGITYCYVNEEGNLYFSVNIPNIICGSIGNGKNLDFVKENLRLIGCLDENYNLIEKASERISAIICACVLCGELSLMSALTNQDELIRSHIILERKNKL